MGSAGYHHYIHVTHPTSMKCDVDVDGGHIYTTSGQEKTPNIIKMRNQTECATGCGGTFTFTRTVKSLESSWTCKKSFKTNFGIEFSAGDTMAAEGMFKGEDVENEL